MLPIKPLVVFFVLVLPQFVVADSDPASSVYVKLRTILGSGAEKANIVVEDKIKDLTKHLKALEYERYALLDFKEESIPIAKIATFKLSHGHLLSLRPLYVRDNKVGMFLKWVNATGMEILDTQMHFSCGEIFITGTEHDPGTGIVLAMEVKAR